MNSRAEPDIQTAKVYPHYKKVGPCLTRPAYRDGRVKKAVKVYTISSESSYLIIFGLPSIHLEQPLRDRCKRFGSVELIRCLFDYPEKELFTDVFLVKMDSVQSARRAKRCLDDSSFYGGTLHVCYAPEFETVAECRIKLHICRRNNARIARKAEFEHTRRLAGLDPHKDPASETITQPCGSSNITPPLNAPLVFSSHNTSVHDAGLPVTPLVNTGSAEGDARCYWLSKGAGFMHSLVSGSTDNTGGQLQSRTTLSGSLASSKPVPLPVLQALSWKPYFSDPLPDKPTIQTRNASSSSSQATPPARSQSTSSQFLPRCLRTKLGKTTDQINSIAEPSTFHVSGAITLGGLKQLAMTLRAEQGPSALPRNYPKLSDSCSRKSIVFHRPQGKRLRFSSPTETPGPSVNIGTFLDVAHLTNDNADSTGGDTVA